MHFHKNGFAWRLILTQRQGQNWYSLTGNIFSDIYSKVQDSASEEPECHQLLTFVFKRLENVPFSYKLKCWAPKISWLGTFGLNCFSIHKIHKKNMAIFRRLNLTLGQWPKYKLVFWSNIVWIDLWLCFQLLRVVVTLWATSTHLCPLPLLPSLWKRKHYL